MGIATVTSRAQIGIDAPVVTIEVFLSGGLPRFSVVGLAEAAVRESKDRVHAALKNCLFRFPQERITANLGPADMKKTGGRFDLGIALGILSASGQLPGAALDRFEFFGELALNGALRPVPGILPAAIKAARRGVPVVVPEENAAEAALADATVYAASNLLDVTAMVRGVVEPEAVVFGSSDEFGALDGPARSRANTRDPAASHPASPAPTTPSSRVLELPLETIPAVPPPTSNSSSES